MASALAPASATARRLVAWAWITLASLLAGTVWGQASSIEGGYRLIDRARFVRDTGALPPAACADPSAAAELVSLPDLWRQRGLASGDSAWYCIQFDGSVQQAGPWDGWAVHIPRAFMNTEVWLNGARVAGLGRMTAPVSERWNKPLLAVLPQALVKPGSNQLAIRLATRKGAPAGLSRITLGSHTQLTARHEHRMLWQWDLAVAASFTVSLLGALALIYGWRARESLSLYFGGAMSLWGSRNLYYFVDSSFGPHWLWNLLVILPVLVAGVWLLQFVLRWHGRHLPRLERALWLLVLIYAFLILVLTIIEKDHWLPLLGLPFGLFQVIVIVIAALESWRSPSAQNLIMVLSMALSFGGSLWDLSIRASSEGLEAYHLRHFAALPFALAVTLMLAQKHLAAQRQILEAEAAAREARNLERARLMRDMHDGLGSQLVTALATLNGPDAPVDRTRHMLEEALEELRLVIGALDREQRDLGETIGNLLYRMSERMEAAGKPLEWTIEADLARIVPTQEAGLNLLRLLQEAIANCAKHATIGPVLISFTIDRTSPAPSPNRSPACQLTISNRIDPAQPRHEACNRPDSSGAPSWQAKAYEYEGLGLGNMTRRAEALGGSLGWVRHEQAWCLTLSLPAGALV